MLYQVRPSSSDVYRATGSARSNRPPRHDPLDRNDPFASLYDLQPPKHTKIHIV